MHRFDDGPYDTIVFDEILFSSVRKLARVKRYCDEHPDKIIVATGDTNQLESIDLITNQHDYDNHYNKCIDLIFPIHTLFKDLRRTRGCERKRTRSACDASNRRSSTKASPRQPPSRNTLN